MKIFVSHKDVDAPRSLLVADALKKAGHTVYVDSLDPHIGKSGDDLAGYLRDQLATCEALVLVLSASTQASWWAPWEIGVASERNYPLGTYQSDLTQPPEFLAKWPLLRNMADTAIFAEELARLGSTIQRRASVERKSFDQLRSLTVPQFHETVKRLVSQNATP